MLLSCLDLLVLVLSSTEKKELAKFKMGLPSWMYLLAVLRCPISSSSSFDQPRNHHHYQQQFLFPKRGWRRHHWTLTRVVGPQQIPMGSAVLAGERKEEEDQARFHGRSLV